MCRKIPARSLRDVWMQRRVGGRGRIRKLFARSRNGANRRNVQLRTRTVTQTCGRRRMRTPKCPHLHVSNSSAHVMNLFDNWSLLRVDLLVRLLIMQCPLTRISLSNNRPAPAVLLLFLKLADQSGYNVKRMRYA